MQTPPMPTPAEISLSSLRADCLSLLPLFEQRHTKIPQKLQLLDSTAHLIALSQSEEAPPNLNSYLTNSLTHVFSRHWKGIFSLFEKNQKSNRLKTALNFLRSCCSLGAHLNLRILALICQNQIFPLCHSRTNSRDPDDVRTTFARLFATILQNLSHSCRFPQVITQNGIFPAICRDIPKYELHVVDFVGAALIDHLICNDSLDFAGKLEFFADPKLVEAISSLYDRNSDRVSRAKLADDVLASLFLRKPAEIAACLDKSKHVISLLAKSCSRHKQRSNQVTRVTTLFPRLALEVVGGKISSKRSVRLLRMLYGAICDNLAGGLFFGGNPEDYLLLSLNKGAKISQFLVEVGHSSKDILSILRTVPQVGRHLFRLYCEDFDACSCVRRCLKNILPSFDSLVSFALSGLDLGELSCLLEVVVVMREDLEEMFVGDSVGRFDAFLELLLKSFSLREDEHFPSFASAFTKFSSTFLREIMAVARADDFLSIIPCYDNKVEVGRVTAAVVAGLWGIECVDLVYDLLLACCDALPGRVVAVFSELEKFEPGKHDIVLFATDTCRQFGGKLERNFTDRRALRNNDNVSSDDPKRNQYSSSNGHVSPYSHFPRSFHPLIGSLLGGSNSSGPVGGEELVMMRVNRLLREEGECSPQLLRVLCGLGRRCLVDIDWVFEGVPFDPVMVEMSLLEGVKLGQSFLDNAVAYLMEAVGTFDGDSMVATLKFFNLYHKRIVVDVDFLIKLSRIVLTECDHAFPILQRVLAGNECIIGSCRGTCPAEEVVQLVDTVEGERQKFLCDWGWRMLWGGLVEGPGLWPRLLDFWGGQPVCDKFCGAKSLKEFIKSPQSREYSGKIDQLVPLIDIEDVPLAVALVDFYSRMEVSPSVSQRLLHLISSVNVEGKFKKILKYCRQIVCYAPAHLKLICKVVDVMPPVIPEMSSTVAEWMGDIPLDESALWDFVSLTGCLPWRPLMDSLLSDMESLWSIVETDHQIGAKILAFASKHFPEMIDSCNFQHLPTLLSLSKATLSAADQCVLHILSTYQFHGQTSFRFCQPVVWGASMSRVGRVDHLLSALSQQNMLSSALNFPLKRTFKKSNHPPDPACYDPCMVLPVFFHLLHQDEFGPVTEFVRKNCLSFTVASLTSSSSHVRKIALSCLVEFYRHMDKCSFPQRQQVKLVLSWVSSCLNGRRLSSVHSAMVTMMLTTFMNSGSRLGVRVIEEMERGGLIRGLMGDLGGLSWDFVWIVLWFGVRGYGDYVLLRDEVGGDFWGLLCWRMRDGCTKTFRLVRKWMGDAEIRADVLGTTDLKTWVVLAARDGSGTLEGLLSDINVL